MVKLELSQAMLELPINDIGHVIKEINSDRQFREILREQNYRRYLYNLKYKQRHNYESVCTNGRH